MAEAEVAGGASSGSGAGPWGRQEPPPSGTSRRRPPRGIVGSGLGPRAPSAPGWNQRGSRRPEAPTGFVLDPLGLNSAKPRSQAPRTACPQPQGHAAGEGPGFPRWALPASAEGLPGAGGLQPRGPPLAARPPGKGVGCPLHGRTQLLRPFRDGDSLGPSWGTNGANGRGRGPGAACARARLPPTLPAARWPFSCMCAYARRHRRGAARGGGR